MNSQIMDASLVLYLALLAQDSKAVEGILVSHRVDCIAVMSKMMRSREDGFSAERKRGNDLKAARIKDKAGSKLVRFLFV